MSKVLCLHGFLQNAKVFSEKSSGLRKLLKKSGIQTDYIDGPVLLEKKDLPFEVDDDKWAEIVESGVNRAWFYHSDISKELDVTDALKTVVEHIKANGPYDGIIGFSQGAAISSIIANTIQSYGLPPFKFALHVSGYTFTEPSENGLVITEKYQSAFSVPDDLTTKTLIIYGENDNSVPKERSIYLSELYKEKTVFNHDGGHFVPNKKDFLKPVVDSIVSALDQE